MPLKSRHYRILEAVADTLNADNELSHLKFIVQKKAKHRDKPWHPGAYVCPENAFSPATENDRDLLGFGVWVVICHPTDADLEDGLEDSLAAIERVEDIFRFKSGGYMPTTLRDGIDNTDDDETMTLVRCNAIPQKRFDQQAFEAGYDVSACTLRLDVRVPRRVVSSL